MEGEDISFVLDTEENLICKDGKILLRNNKGNVLYN